MTKKPPRDPGAPKRNMSAYLLYQNAMREQFKAQNPGMTFGQLAKYTSAMYAEMPPQEKQAWVARAEADKARYLHELASYVPPPGYDAKGDAIIASTGNKRGGKRGKPERDANAPKRNMSAYLLYQNAMRDTFKRDNPGMTFGQLAKYTSHMYKKLNPVEKATWDLRAAQDKQRYDAALAAYVPPPGHDSRGNLVEEYRTGKRQKRTPKDPAAPKRARGSFVFFTFDMRPQIMIEFPGIKFVEMGTILGERWRALTPIQKKKYENMAAEDKVRFEREMQKYTSGQAQAQAQAQAQIHAQAQAQAQAQAAAQAQAQAQALAQAQAQARAEAQAVAQAQAQAQVLAQAQAQAANHSPSKLGGHDPSVLQHYGLSLEQQHQLQQHHLKQSYDQQHLEQQHLDQEQLGQQHLEQHQLGEHQLEEHQLEQHHLDPQQLEQHQLDQHQLQQHQLVEQHLAQQQLAEQHLGEQHLGEQNLAEQHLGEQHLGEQHLGEQHLTEQHLGEQHLTEQHLGEQHLGEQHLTEHHLGEQHLAEQHLEQHQQLEQTNGLEQPEGLEQQQYQQYDENQYQEHYQEQYQQYQEQYQQFQEQYHAA